MEAPDIGELHLDSDSPTLERGPPTLNVGTLLTVEDVPRQNLGAPAGGVNDNGVINLGSNLVIDAATAAELTGV